MLSVKQSMKKKGTILREVVCIIQTKTFLVVKMQELLITVCENVILSTSKRKNEAISAATRHRK